MNRHTRYFIIGCIISSGCERVIAEALNEKSKIGVVPQFIMAFDLIKQGEQHLKRSNEQLAKANALRKKLISSKIDEREKLFSQIKSLEQLGEANRKKGNDFILQGKTSTKEYFYEIWQDIPKRDFINPVETVLTNKQQKSIDTVDSEKSTVPQIELIMGDAQPRPDYINYQPIVLSNNKTYFAHIESEVIPIDLNHMHQWTLTLIDDQARPVKNASIEIFGHMPGHVHGMPTSPAVEKELTPGRYLIEGMKFQMQGWWVVEFTVQVNDIKDHFVFNLEI